MSEKFPSQFNQPSWQDITLEDIHKLIAQDELDSARTATNLRLEALRGIIADIEAALPVDESGEFTDEDWQIEKQAITEEIQELEKIKHTLATQQELE